MPAPNSSSSRPCDPVHDDLCYLHSRATYDDGDSSKCLDDLIRAYVVRGCFGEGDRLIPHCLNETNRALFSDPGRFPSCQNKESSWVKDFSDWLITRSENLSAARALNFLDNKGLQPGLNAGSHCAGKDFKRQLSKQESGVPRRIFAHWFGPLPEDRRSHIEVLTKMFEDTDVEFTLVTDDSLDRDWVVPEHPLPPQVAHLSAIHRSDYLRAYIGHFWGGGYMDVKPVPRQHRSEYRLKWSSMFDELNRHVDEYRPMPKHVIQFSGRPGGATNCGCDIGVTLVYLRILDDDINTTIALVDRHRSSESLSSQHLKRLRGLEREKRLFNSWASRYGPPASEVDWSNQDFDRWKGYHWGSQFGLCRVMRSLDQLIGGITNFIIRPRSELTEMWLALANWKLSMMSAQLARARAVNPKLTEARCGAEYFSCEADSIYLQKEVTNLSNQQHCLLSDWSLIRGDPFPYFKNDSAYPVTWNGIGSSLLCPVQVLFLGQIQTGQVPPFHILERR